MIDHTQPSMLELHSQALQDVDTAYHDFLLIYRKDVPCVYGFVEGKDDPCFYRHLIEKELPEEWSIKLIQSGSRDKVLRSYWNFNWSNYCRTRICFFVDRDMHDFLNTPVEAASNIYVTDGYSIENSVLGDRLLKSVLSDVYQINLNHPNDENKIEQIVKANEDTFFEAILPVMGQIMVWRRSGTEANLSNLKLDQLFSFTEAKCQPKGYPALLKESANQIGCDLCNSDDIEAAINEIRCHAKPRMMVRGKYALWFFLKQCEAIWESIPNLLPRFSSKPKKRTDFGIKNAMVIIGSRANAPESLKEFIKQNYLSFIGEVNNQ
jgi:Protein of unknown function (DUF4435)